jgi:hypothetical protein
VSAGALVAVAARRVWPATRVGLGGLGGLLVLMTLGWLLWASAVPFGEAPDEPSHLEVAAFIAAQGRLPTFGPAGDFYIRLDQVGIPIEPHALAPPLPYLLDAALLRLLPVEPVAAARLGALLAALAAVALTYMLVRGLLPQRPDLALPAAALVAATPQVSFQAAVVNSDVVALAAALGALCLARAAHRPLGALAFGVAVGLALLAKYTAYPLAALAVLAAGWRVWTAGRAAWRRGVAAALAGVGAVLVAGPWLVHNGRLYGAPWPLPVAEAAFWAHLPAVPIAGAPGSQHPLDPAYLRAWLLVTWPSFWAGFGRVDVFAPAWCYAVIGGVLAVAVVGGLRAWAAGRGGPALSRGAPLADTVLLVAWAPAVLVPAVALSFGRYYPVHGRYLLTLLPLVALGVVVGWRAALPRWPRRAAWAPVAVLAALNVYCLLGVVVPQYYGPAATRVTVTVDSPRPGPVAPEGVEIRGWAVTTGREAWTPGQIGGAPAWARPAADLWVTVDGAPSAAVAGGGGQARPDVARALAAPAAATAGFAFRWDARGAAPGVHRIEVCAADPAAARPTCVPVPVVVPDG